VTYWQNFRDAVRERRIFLHQNSDMSKGFVFSPRLIVVESGSVCQQYVYFFNHLLGEEPVDSRLPTPPLTTNFDGLPPSNRRKAFVQAPRHDKTSPRGLEE
jgi:hypothetical protein